MKKKNLLVGASALLLMASMNLGHAFNEYGFLNGNLCGSILAQTTSGSGGGSSTGGNSSSSGTSSSGTSSSSGSDTSSRTKVKQYRNVPCTYKWESTINGSGTVTINGIRVNITGGKIGVTIDMRGEKENCTGGDDWYDCDGAQTECVFKKII